MKKIVFLILALSFLTSCRLHDKYTGEPLIHIEYTVDGEHFVYEDWGHIEAGFLSDRFKADSKGNLRSQIVDANESIAVLALDTSCISLYLESDWRFFTDSKRYEYKEDPQKQGLDGCKLIQPKQGTITGGWYTLTRKCVEPYCTYDLHFEFTGRNSEGEFAITDGIIQVGRRFQQTGVDGLIRNEERP